VTKAGEHCASTGAAGAQPGRGCSAVGAWRSMAQHGAARHTFVSGRGTLRKIELDGIRTSGGV
jgi:hypothetical protein